MENIESAVEAVFEQVGLNPGSLDMDREWRNLTLQSIESRAAKAARATYIDVIGWIVIPHVFTSMPSPDAVELEIAMWAFTDACFRPFIEADEERGIDVDPRGTDNIGPYLDAEPWQRLKASELIRTFACLFDEMSKSVQNGILETCANAGLSDSDILASVAALSSADVGMKLSILRGISSLYKDGWYVPNSDEEIAIISDL